MLNWLRQLWYKHCRSIDLNILWPSCKEYAPDLDHARAAFALHAFNDNAWLVLGETGIIQIIDELK